MRIWGQAEPSDVESGQDVAIAADASIPANEKEGENNRIN